MVKVLSVCIPSYNMEKYLKHNIDSFISSGQLDDIELIIVNDGSKDKTLEIANEYKAKYPNAIKVIDKPNGHYGSCVNAALKIATGKYFRIVDADDWIDPSALKYAISKLYTISVDCVYTRYSRVYEHPQSTENMPFDDRIIWDKVIDLNGFILTTDYLHMHTLTYSLTFLKSINYHQTEGICYTDCEYVYMPMVSAQTMYCIDCSLYQYFVGREDQSMSGVMIDRNFMHLQIVFDSIVNYINPSYSNNNYSFIRKTLVCVPLKSMLRNHLYDNGKNKEHDIILRHDIQKLTCEDISEIWSMRSCKMPYVKFWYESKLLFFVYRFIKFFRIFFLKGSVY